MTTEVDELRAELDTAKARAEKAEFIIKEAFGAMQNAGVDCDESNDLVAIVEGLAHNEWHFRGYAADQRARAEKAEAREEKAEARVAELEKELERRTVQLAGCGAAALGYAEDVERTDYGYSCSLEDVRRMYKECRDAKARVAELEKLLDVDVNMIRYATEWYRKILDRKKAKAGETLTASFPALPVEPYADELVDKLVRERVGEQRRSILDVKGQWPGDETDEEIAKALKEIG